jgi:hypothetical protein
LKRLSTLLVIIALVALVLAACAGQTPASLAGPTDTLPVAPPTARTVEQTRLEQALAFVPMAYAPSMYFTDWRFIKLYEGALGVTSQSPWDERRSLFLATHPYNLVSVQGAMAMQQHEATWGWDFSDLDWEAFIVLDDYQLPGAPAAGSQSAYVLKLRRDMDLAPILAHFAEYGFAAQPYGGVDVYSRSPEPGAAWLKVAGPAVVNTAILPDQKILILSEQMPIVHALLDTLAGKEPPLAESGGLATLRAVLNDSLTTYVAGGAACAGWNPLNDPGARGLSRLSKEQRAEVERLLGDGSPLHPYIVGGVSYRIDDGKADNMLVLEYASSSDAEADLETRRRIIAEGSSLAGDPYSAVMTVKSASRNDKTLIFDLSPVIGAGPQRNRLPDLLMGNDMLFAACP